MQPDTAAVVVALPPAIGFYGFGNRKRTTYYNGGIKIVRIVKGEKKEVKVKLTDAVQPGDTLVVKERFF